MRTVTFIFCVAFCLMPGCATPPHPPANDDPQALRTIRAAFNDVVARAKSDPKIRWVSGWDGNSEIEKNPGPDIKGLCWEWQELVFSEIAPVAARVHWQIAKININRGWFSEHNAVVVWDAQRTDRKALLENGGNAAWVLDPWQNGAPDIFTLADWLDIPVIVFESAGLEDDPAAATPEAAPGNR